MKYEHVVFLEVGDVIEIHRSALLTGGIDGVLNSTLLDSAVKAPKATFDGKPLYDSLASMAAAYAWGLARNHAFVDGNKRTAFQSALTFLDTNGYRLTVGMEWVEIMVRIAGEPPLARRDVVDAFIRAMVRDEPVSA